MARRGVLVRKMGGICAFWGVFSGKVADWGVVLKSY